MRICFQPSVRHTLQTLGGSPPGCWLAAALPSCDLSSEIPRCQAKVFEERKTYCGVVGQLLLRHHAGLATVLHLVNDPQL